MSDIDMSLAAMDDFEPEVILEEDPWLARRRESFGASDIAALLIALGMRKGAGFPKFICRSAKKIKVGRVAAPRLFLEKAGLKKGLKPSGPMSLGTEREPDLIRQFTHKVRRGKGGAAAKILDPNTIVHSAAFPQSFYPLRHHKLPLAITPDAWGYDLLGDLVMLEAKCSYQRYQDRYRDAAPHHVLQLHAQMMVTDAVAGIAVEGEAWSNPFFDHAGEPMGAITTWPVSRDENIVKEIESAVVLGWEMVEEIKCRIQ